MTKHEEKIQIKAHETTKTYYICDTCGKRVVDTAWGKLKNCRICKNHVCQECAIITDHWYLEDGHFAGDYPDYYCKSCWESGKELRETILKCREQENDLWEKWHGVN